MQKLHRRRRLGLRDRRQLGVESCALVEALDELWILNIQNHREDATSGVVGPFDHLDVVVASVEADRFIEARALKVIEIHRRKDRQQEETAPQPRLPVIEELGLSLHDGVEEIAMAVLVLAPVLKEAEDRVNPVFGMGFQVAVNRDVAPVADLLRQVSRVEDELRLEEGVLPALGQKPEVKGELEVRHGFVEEASVTSLVPRHEVKALSQQRAFVFEATPKFLVEQEAREFSGAGTLQEFNKEAALFTIDVIPGLLELGIPHKVMTVVVSAKLFQDRS